MRPLRAEDLPLELTRLPNWLAWKFEKRPGTDAVTKVPYSFATERPASSTKPEDWMPFEDAAWFFSDRYDGMGIALTDGIVGGDFDDCYDEHGNLKPWAAAKLAAFKSTYSETSPSGKGIKFFCFGRLPGPGKKTFVNDAGEPCGLNDPRRDGAIELYGPGRYFTVTSQAIGPLTLVDCQDAINNLYAFLSKSRATVTQPSTEPALGLAIVPRTPRDLSPTETATPGGRHALLLSVAGRWRGAGMEPAELTQRLRAFNASNCFPPKPDFEIKGIVDFLATKPVNYRIERHDVELSRHYASQFNPPPQAPQGQGPIQQGNAERAPVQPPPPPPDQPTLNVILPADDEEPDLTQQTLTDAGNVERLIALHGKDMLFCPPMRKWLLWDGKRWCVDHGYLFQELAIDTARAFVRQVNTRCPTDSILRKYALSTLNASKLEPMLRLARGRQQAWPVELDNQPYLLNCTNGTIDLRTSTLSPHRREDLLTKTIHFDYDPAAACPQWLKFIEWAMCGGPNATAENQERATRFISYLQIAFGYSITGITSEKAFFVLNGESGDNGKTTMSNAIREVVSEYATAISIESLMSGHENNSANMQSDLADLRGCRFVQTSEAQRSQRLDQAKLKQLASGSGKFKTCRKFENTIEFEQTWHIWLDTNPLPVIKDSDDEATIARLHPIAFNNQISAGDKDPLLPAKLKAEAPGILAWLVEGARLWYANGLQKPAEVTAAREAWKWNEDVFGRWIEERCMVATAWRGKPAAMYADYKAWCERSGERPAAMRHWGGRMRKNHDHKHTNKGDYYEGITLRDDEPQPADRAYRDD